jgi:hypothetical protein
LQQIQIFGSAAFFVFMYKRGDMSDWLSQLRKEYKITPIPEISVLTGVDLLSLCRIINNGELISEDNYKKEARKIKSFLDKKYKPAINPTVQEQELFLSLVDFIFTESEVLLDDILDKYKPSSMVKDIIDVAVKENMIQERKEVYQKSMSTRGRPQIKTFYKLSCRCSAPGLTPHCRLCGLGQKIISIEGIEEII